MLHTLILTTMKTELQYVCLFPLQKLIDSDDDNDDDNDGYDVLGEEPQSVALLFIASAACCCTTTGSLRLPTMSTQVYLFICLPSWRENSSFLIFGNGKGKQVVP